MKRRLTVIATILGVCLTGVFLAGCTEVSLVQKEYSETFYEVPRKLGDSLTVETPEFIVIGDAQAAWRAEHRFYRSENWFTWRHLLFPFYQVYLLTNGIVGAANWGRGVPDYGAEWRARMRVAVEDAAEEMDAHFIMMLGDMVDNGRYGEQWENFLQEYAGPGDLLSEFPFLPMPGNHERANDTTFAWPNYQAVLDYPRFYVQKMDEGVIFVLDSNFLIDQYGLLELDEQDRLFKKWFISDNPENPAWLERQLEKYDDRRYKMIAMHHSILTFAWHAYDWYSKEYGRNLQEKRQKLLRLFGEHGVQVVFSGHEHLYEHNIFEYAAPTGGTDILHTVITSGAGTPVRKTATADEFEERMQQYEEANLDVTNVIQRSVYHYTEVVVDEEALTIETYQVEPTTPQNNELLERIVIEPPANLAQDDTAGPAAGS